MENTSNRGDDGAGRDGVFREAGEEWRAVAIGIAGVIQAGGMDGDYLQMEARSLNLSMVIPFLEADSTAVFKFVLYLDSEYMYNQSAGQRMDGGWSRWDSSGSVSSRNPTNESNNTGVVLASCLLKVRVLPVYNISIETDPRDIFLYPGENRTYSLLLKNRGNSYVEGNIDITILYPPSFNSTGFTLYLERWNFSLNINESISIPGLVAGGEDARAGCVSVCFSIPEVNHVLLPAKLSTVMETEIGRVVDISLSLQPEFHLAPGEAETTNLTIRVESNFDHSIELKWGTDCRNAVLIGLSQTADVRVGSNTILYYVQAQDGPDKGSFYITISYIEDPSYGSEKTRVVRGSASGTSLVFISGIEPNVGSRCLQPLLFIILCGVLLTLYIYYRERTSHHHEPSPETAFEPGEKHSPAKHGMSSPEGITSKHSSSRISPPKGGSPKEKTPGMHRPEKPRTKGR